MKLNQILTATAAMVVLGASAAFAQDATTAGSTLLTTLNGLLTGNLGLFVGLGVAALGLWMWLVKQSTVPGILMIIGGVLLTAAPAVFNGTRVVVAPALNSATNGTEAINNNTVTVKP